jgi:hypothetical protein
MDVKPKGFLRRLVDLAVTEIERRSRSPGASPSSLPPAHADDAAGDSLDRNAPPQLQEVERQPARVDHEEGAITLEVEWVRPDEARIRWSLQDEDLAPARDFIHANAELAVRTVAFCADRNGVVREASDVAVRTLQGELLLQRARPERLLVAVGLLHDAEFRSLAHLEVR